MSKTGDVTDESDKSTTGLNALYTDSITAGSCEGNRVIFRKWELQDDCGNKAADQIQTITVSDTIAPSFTAPADITIYTDASCNYNALPAVTGNVADVSDNCSTGITATYTDSIADGPCEGSKVITRTWHLLDKCNNAATDQIQTITVSDTLAPSFTRPADITIYTDSIGNYDSSVSETGDVSDESDNCSTVLQATYTDSNVAGPCEGTRVITRTWHLTDSCGNAAADQQQTITVSDTTAPAFTRPPDITIYSDSSCVYDASVSKTGDVTDESDNSTTGLNALYTDSITAGSCEGNLVIFRKWKLQDDCGNKAADQIQTITVSDTIAPSFTAPADITIYTDASCNYNALPAVTGNVADVSDNCSTGITATYTDSIADGPCEGSKVITRTWHLLDKCNNAAADQIQTITVSDTLAPSFTRPADITIYTDSIGNYDSSVSETGDVSDESDNCSTVLQATYTDSNVAGPCEGTRVITRTWHLTDSCGNAAADQQQTITVSDTTAPAFTRPPDITIYSDSSCVYDASVSKTGDVTDESDNSTTGLNALYTDSITAGSCEGNRVIFRKWELQDDCGNKAADQIQTITVSDTIAPSFTAPADITIYTDASCNYNALPAVTGNVAMYQTTVPQGSPLPIQIRLPMVPARDPK